MRFNPKARIDEGQIEDRTGRSGGGLGGSGMSFPIPSGGGGKIGLGTIIVVVLFFVVSTCTGNSPLGGGSDNTPDTGTAGTSNCATGADANQDSNCAIDLITNSVQDFWRTAYPRETGTAYQPIKTVRFSGQTSSACGTAASAMGPFYCPNDKLVYIDTSFMKDMLQGQLGAKGGPFALGYVLAHEYGHHIEDQLGLLAKMRTQQGPRSDSVRIELMADCLGGMWAHAAGTTKDADGNVLIEGLTQDDVARAIDAAQSVGDDRIQKETSGRVNQESWTHGSSAQRQKWFTVGYNKSSINACNTFETDDL